MKGQLKNITAMLIWGSIGIFVKNIHLSSSEIALLRGIIGSVFLIFFFMIAKQKPSIQAVKNNLVLLILSGVAVGFNWILLFQSYRYTTVSNATLSYYFAPVFVMALSPLVLKERLTPAKVGCIIAAMIGLFLVVNIGGDSGDGNYHHLTGILYGLSAAAFYASVVLINKFIKNLSGFETTLVQLLVASIILFPYVMMRENLNLTELTSQSIIFIFIIGIIHTGIAYFLYFTSIKELKGQRIAVLSYIDPISAVIFAAIFLGEGMDLLQIIGGILILGSTFLSERIEIQIQKMHNSKV
ncbi:EamA family transporter [Neobacillus niacini]|uniref:DMT family transporter n=1 Tax=Neobacillus niacini TaxID=86668 RepID=UPI002864DC0B|nr:EamA family transporter [Neobacillus niacini]MDR6999052.1 RarD protein [Neobacillus niacini]